MPVPAAVRLGTGRVPIDAKTTIALTGFVDDRLRAGVTRALVRLQGRTGLVLSREFSSNADAATLVVTCKGPGLSLPALDEDESYTLDAGSPGRAVRQHRRRRASRARDVSAARSPATATASSFPAVSIQDRPRFPWRGLLIDAGRHFEPVEVIKRELDAMAAVKLNVLHWHLSEDQGFRVESRKFPKLHELGSDGQYYTQDQLRDVVEYARMRGIRVVPEFDMPGHVTSWVVGYPELASAPGPYAIARKFGVFDAGVRSDARLTPTSSSTRSSARSSKIFPGRVLAHRRRREQRQAVGGEPEDPGVHEEARDQGRARAADVLQPAAARRSCKKHGKRMMGWDEIFQPGLPKETVIQSWRGQKSLVDAAKQGYDGVLSAGYYIDLLNTAATHYAVDPLPGDQRSDAPPKPRTCSAARRRCGASGSGRRRSTRASGRARPRSPSVSGRRARSTTSTTCTAGSRVVSMQLEELGLTHERNADVLLRRLTAGARSSRRCACSPTSSSR